MSCESHPSSPLTPHAAALLYAGRGWSVVPIPFRSKNPGFDDWPQMRLTIETIGQHFNGKPQNIGVLLGEPSGWLIDVDLDHPLAVKLASQYLPPTPAIFGRAGKLGSHWVYRVTAPAATKKFRSKSAGMISEFRSTGAQTVFPPSVHECGEPIQWEDENAEPATVDPEELLACVKRLADAVKVELGEKAVSKAPKEKRTKVPKPEATTASVPPPEPAERSKRCLAAMLRMNLVDHNDGSSRLFACSCRIVEHDLDDRLALSVFKSYVAERPFPRTWSDDEILQRVRDAESVCQRGVAFEPDLDEDGQIRLGTRDPATGKLVLSPKRTLPTAQAYIAEFHEHPEGRTLHSYAGLLLDWRNNRYAEIEDEAIKQRLQSWLHQSLKPVCDRETEEIKLVPFDSNPTTVKAGVDSIRSFAHLPVTTASPSWLCDSKTKPLATEILPCRSTLLHLPTMTHLPATPALFTTNALDFDPDPNAPEPMLWHQFLHQLFDGDLEALELLQDWFGYCLTGDTSQQKMLLLVGPKRSGKGTIGRVLKELVGGGNACGPTTSSLAGPFGLQPLIGKTLAIVSDARFTGENIPTVVERLLCISGEDPLTVDRKFLGSVTMKLPTRFMFMTNELPKMNDASGALAGRFVILRLIHSFYGKEDPDLTHKLLAELPGILNWSIEGWKRLRERKRFIQPQSVEDVVRDLENLASPVGAFVREECVVGAGRRTSVDELYGAWKRWCESEGRNIVPSKSTFGRDLSAAVPGVVCRRGTGNARFYEGIAWVGRQEMQ